MSEQNDVTVHLLDSDGRPMTEKTVSCPIEEFNADALVKLISTSRQNDVALHFLDSDGRLMKTVTCPSKDFNSEVLENIISYQTDKPTGGDSDDGGEKANVSS